MRPRWHKVFADLWGNKARSILVSASIMVGLFAVGMIATIYRVISEDMREGYAAIHPANIQIFTSPFNDELVDRIREVEGVQAVEGVHNFNLRLEASPGEWITTNIKAIADFEDRQVNQVRLEEGKWPPDDREVIIERNKLPDTNANIGDLISFELPSGKIRQMRLVGVVHDQSIGASGLGGGFFLAPVQGYITSDSLEWLEETRDFNTLYVTVEGDNRDEAWINEVAKRVREEIDDSNVLISSTVINPSDNHPNSIWIDAIAAVLFLLGLLVVFLSGFLITNTLSALLNQQVQQIGVMKTVGARRSQIAGIYMMLIFVFGVLAFVIALPLSFEAAFRMVSFLGEEINFVFRGYRVITSVVILEIAIALLMPQFAGIVPIMRGTGITVQEALSGVSQTKPVARKQSPDNSQTRLRWIPRPLLISLRNAFRRKGRLALTLVTLTLGGAIFIATFNVRVSLTQYIDRVSKYFLADVNLTMDRPYRIEEIRQVVSDVPGVAYVEGWGEDSAELILDDGTVGDSVAMLAPPADSALVDPILIEGRWIVPGDENAIVLNELFISRFPDLDVGDVLRIRLNGKEDDWLVVGFFQLAGKSGGFLTYVNYDYLSSLLHQPNKASTFRIVGEGQGLSEENQKQLGQEIEAHLREGGYRISSVSSGQFLRDASADGLSILTGFLLFMAILTALVGSIGLAGTMSMNVMERTREIGVMRAVGASNRILMIMVIVEAMIIGLASWVFGSILAFPISKIMSDTVSYAIFDTTTEFGFTPTGFIIWLVAVLVLSVLASVGPAKNAARLTIREVLAYE